VKGLRIVFATAAWLFLAGVITQVFLAGASLFGLTDWTTHRGLGWTLGPAPILLLVLALLARVGRRTVLLTIGLAVATVIQPELALARDTDPVVAAFHPVNALVVFWLAWVVARRSLDEVRRADDQTSRVAATVPSDAPPAAGTG
jgi:hypothetical protein